MLNVPENDTTWKKCYILCDMNTCISVYLCHNMVWPASDVLLPLFTMPVSLMCHAKDVSLSSAANKAMSPADKLGWYQACMQHSKQALLLSDPVGFYHLPASCQKWALSLPKTVFITMFSVFGTIPPFTIPPPIQPMTHLTLNSSQFWADWYWLYLYSYKAVSKTFFFICLCLPSESKQSSHVLLGLGQLLPFSRLLYHCTYTADIKV